MKYNKAFKLLVSAVMIANFGCASARVDTSTGASPTVERKVAASAPESLERELDASVIQTSQEIVNRYYGFLKSQTKCATTRDCSRSIAVLAGNVIVIGVGSAATGVGMMFAVQEMARYVAHYSATGVALNAVSNGFARLMLAGAAATVAGTVVVVPSALVYTFMPTPAEAGELDVGILGSQTNFEKFMNLPLPQQTSILNNSLKLKAVFVAAANQIIETTKTAKAQ